MKKNVAYRNYKASNVSWIGDIPEHWALRRVKHLFRIKKQIAGKLGFDVLSITQKGIKVKDVESGAGQLAMDYSKYQLIDKGDFGMNHMDLLTGYVDISKFIGVISPDYRVFSLRNKNCYDRYFLHLFQMAYNSRIFYGLGQGSSQLGRWRLPADEFNGFILPLPSKEEQMLIANYLDELSERIRNFISLKEKAIELLTEQKNAVIDEIVNNGLNLQSDYIDSEVDWLGKIPASWKVKRLKYLSRIKTGERDTVNRDDNAQYPFFVRSDTVEKISTYSFDGEAVLTAGDGAGVAKVFHYVNGKFDYHQRVYKISNFKEVLGEYFYYYGKANFVKEVMRISAKTTIDSLRLPMLLNFPVCVPCKDEQLQIINSITKKTREIDKVILQNEKEIRLIKEYQQSLISEAITGKIDVRGGTIRNITPSYSHHEV